MIKKKSIKINAVLNILNTFLTMSFSLLTYPYASRVLQVENWGKVNYTNSIVSYFVLIAGLGISTYAVREGSGYKEQKRELNLFASQMFSFNFGTSVIAYALLIIIIFLNPSLREYWLLFLIQGVAIINVWIGANWINIVFEDYVFITIRSIVVQLLSIVMLFSFVKEQNDFYLYAAINVSSNFVVGIINLFYVSRYCKFYFTTHINIRKHLKPILVFFSNTLAVTIYINSDTTMLGWRLGNYYVGLYSVAVKIYTAIKTIIAAVYNVSISRLSEHVAQGDMQSYKVLLNKIINTVILFSLPATFCLFVLAKEIIILLSGQEYIASKDALKILALAIFFAIMGGVLAYCVDVPLKQERKVLIATIVSAVENIVLNIFLIPRMGIKGTALTTLIAEITVFVILLIGLKTQRCLFDINAISINIIKCTVAIIPMFGLKYLYDYWGEGRLLIKTTIFTIIVGVGYIGIGLVLKNEYLLSLLKLNVQRRNGK